MALGEFFSQFRSLLFGKEDLLQNRRNQPRLAVDLPVLIEYESQHQPARVCDFGATGLRLQSDTRLVRGRRVRVQVLAESGLESARPVICKVAWCKPVEGSFHIGCRYDDKPDVLATSWVQMLLAERFQRNRDRRNRRVETTIPAQLLEQGKPAVDVFVLDLGLGGARVYCSQAWNPEQAVRLRFGLPGQSSTVDFLVGVVEGKRVDGSGYSYRLRFLDPDGKRLALLRRMLLQLLEGVRRAGRQRPADVIPAPEPESPGARPLGEAVRAPRSRKREGISPYLQAPELPKRSAASKSRPAAEPLPPPPPSLEPPILGTVQRLQGGLLPQDPWQRRRGWLSAALDGWFPGEPLASDFCARPTLDFLATQSPLTLAPWALMPLLPLLIDSRLERGFVLGPGLLYTDRWTLARWWILRRNGFGWVAASQKTRERHERRASSLRDRALHLLAMLGCGGQEAVRQFIVCSQVATGIARCSGLADSLRLNQVRLAAMLKDLGEALLFIATQHRSLRDRYALFLNGVEFGDPDLGVLTVDWSGFQCPKDLWVHRHSLDALSLECLPTHPALGEALLRRLGFPAEVCLAIRHHHEAWNGQGYPEGLAGEDIPWNSRCLALADGFASALTAGLSPDQAFARVSADQGEFYQAEMLKALQAYLHELGVMR